MKFKAFKGEKKGEPHSAYLKDIYLSRYLDQKMFRLSRQNKGAALQLSAEGHELVGILTAHALKPAQDWAYPYYRDQPFAVAWGCPGAWRSRCLAVRSGCSTHMGMPMREARVA